VARAVRTRSRVDAAVLAACAGLALLITILPPNLREGIAAGLRRTIVAPIIGLQVQAERARSAFVMRDVTAARMDSLALSGSRLVELQQENERLRRLLGLGRELRWGFIPAEALHARGAGDENSIVLTAGSAQGVTTQAPVVAPDGLVGIVTSVDRSTSVAILSTHPEFRVSAMAADMNAFGIINPHLGDGAERYLLELRGVTFRETLKPGTLIRSSGLGRVVPRGIPIGRVMGEARTSEEWSRTYLVQPAVRQPDVTNVMILVRERADDDVTSVWPAPTEADAALRRVAAAGDSVAQVARRDSVRRDSLSRDPTRRDSTSRRLPSAVPR
jgi:rod shape-determining protein MreC